ncbi:MAG: hypothetical protein JXL81_06395, partial [Deltaproteobacteria bacterium]|nr:hypothetical protein [Deltaproteobacteria bacterium]
FKGVISGCDDLISRFGTKGLTPDLGIVLVESLSKSNMVSEALAVSRSILDAVERRPDLIRFLVDGVELEMKMGNMENARRLYEKLIDNINERNSLFKKAGDLISENKDNGTAVDDAIKDKLMDITPEKSIQLRQLADTVEELLSQKDFSGARLELVRHRLRAEEGPELEMIEQLLKGVDKAEEQFETGNSNDRMVIDDARRLIEEEKYLQALDILEPLVAAGINYEAEKLKREAVEKYINSEKLLAANLKRESNKVIEITRKRELLIKAKSIFQNLIEKFPESPLIDRVKRNISVIDEELVDLSSHSD